MKKDYKTPSLDIILFSSENILTQSGGEDIVTPEDEFFNN